MRGSAEALHPKLINPWRQVAYGEQLKRKHARVAAALAHITKLATKAHRAAAPAGSRVWPAWLRAARGAPGSAAAPLVGIVRSPQLEGFCNKCGCALYA